MDDIKFNKEQPQDWLKGVNNAFTMWIRTAEKEGGRMKFKKDFVISVPKTKKSEEEEYFPIKSNISYSASDLNSIYMMVTDAVRKYMKS